MASTTEPHRSPAAAAADQPERPPAGWHRRQVAGGFRTGAAGLALGSLAIAAAFAAPFAYLVLRTAALERGLASVLEVGRLAPVARSLLLATAVAGAAAVLGLGCGWLVARTDLPGRRAWAVLLALPLAIPSYIGAFALRAALATGGLAERLLAPLTTVSFPRIEGFWAAFGVLALLTYPYVFLPVVARLRQLPASHEESARLLGSSALRAFSRIVWPQARGAVLAGALLVFLYVLSDFGAVQLLRYDTLTRVIFASALDRGTSFPAALQLALLALVVVSVERLVTRRDRSAGRAAHGTSALVVGLRAWRVPATATVGAVSGLALVTPLAVLGYWALRGLADQAARSSALTSAPGTLLELTVNTAGVSVATAIAAVGATLPVAYLLARHRGLVAAATNAVVVAGFALPGLVLALALAALALQGPAALGWAYQTLPLLVLAYVVHFGAQALRSSVVGVGVLPPSLDDAARLLGAGRLRRLVRIELPLLRPALVAGGGLVLLSTMKELPATLLLAPPGFFTLATRIWGATEDAFWADASLASLVLVCLSGVLTWLLILRRTDALA